MEDLDKLLAAIPKDEKGFEDIDKFWNVTDKLTFPFTQRFKTKFFQLSSSTKKVSGQRRRSGVSSTNTSAFADSAEGDSDSDFDYDTSSSISVVSDIIDEDEDLSEIEPDESFNRDKSTRSSASSKSLLATPVSATSTPGTRSTRTSKTSSSHKKTPSGQNLSSISGASSNSDASTTEIVSSSHLSSFAEEEDSRLEVFDVSAVTARGRKSSLLSQDSQIGALEQGTPTEKGAAQTPISGKSNNKSGNNGRPSTDAGTSESPLAESATTPASGLREKRATRSSLLPSSGKDALSSIKKHPNRRVSFEADVPLDVDFDDEADTDEASRHSSTMLSASKNTTVLSSEAASALSPVDTSLPPDFDYEHEEEPPEEEESLPVESMEASNILSTTRVSVETSVVSSTSHVSIEASNITSTSHVSMEASNITSTSRGKRRKTSSMSSMESVDVTTTPKSHRSANDSTLFATPMSNEFKGGRRLSDSTFIGHTDADNDSEDEEFDKNVDDSDEFASKKRSKSSAQQNNNNNNTSDIADLTSPEAGDVSLSFVDQSFLQTISSANKMYVGKKLLTENAQKRKEQLQQQRSQRRLKRNLSHAHSDDDEPEYEEDEDDEPNARRSRRATKGMRFAFWKNERPIYEEGVLVDVVHAEPTPKKPRRAPRANNKSSKSVKRKLTMPQSSSDEGEPSSKRHRKGVEEGVDEEEEEVSVPDNVSFLEPTTHETLQIWDDYYDRPVSHQVVYVAEAQPAPQALPVTGVRPKNRMKDVGFAAHYFQAPEMAGGSMSGWMAGSVELPPHAIKDAEGVGKYCQVFFVASAQAHSIEFGLASPDTDAWEDRTAQRLLLSAGDSFYVPPGNIYRLENHSKTTTARLFWMIVFPVEDQEARLQQATVQGSNHTVVSGVSR